MGGRIVIAPVLALAGTACGDTLLESYDADVLPEEAAWTGGFCDGPCSAALENGYFVLRWTGGGDLINYTRFISNQAQEPPPPETFWVEWRFRSNTTLTTSAVCDAEFHVSYKHTSDTLYMLGDAAVSQDQGSYRALDPGDFYTYRFESLDGVNYSFLVNGDIFLSMTDQKNYIGVRVQMRGSGDCLGDEVNEWDFVRWGEIGYGEQLVSSDPPAGVVNAAAVPNLDRFTVTFDQPNYVLVDEVTVGTEARRHEGTQETSKSREVEKSKQRQATEGNEILRFAQNDDIGRFAQNDGTAAVGGDVPQVIATRRLDNGPADTVEIVLDGPLPLNATTTFTFDDGVAVNVVAYTYVVIGACCTSGECTETGEPECDAIGGAFTAAGSCEGDADEDGVDGTCGDGCPGDAGKLTPGQCGCGNSDLDSDEDSVADCRDQCDGEDDRLDEDDNGTPDCAEFQPIPTTTAWGIGIMSLLLLITVKVRTNAATAP